jgi:hypothetical protein
MTAAGAELKPSYYRQAVKNLAALEARKPEQLDLGLTGGGLRLYAEYLATVADEASGPGPEPEVEELIAVLGATEARYLGYEEALRMLARAVLAAGYRREADGA